jgi:pyridoxamine 5'-phosphate oxidase-like protein
VHETREDIAHLDELIERSFAEAGAHLVSIATPGRRLSGAAVCARLAGMSLLALATVSSDGRPIVGAVDGIFYRAAFYFSSSRDSLRYRHLTVRPQVSATHLPGEHLAVTVHGRAVEIDLDAADQGGFRETVLDVYLPRYGDEFLELLETGVVYWRIDADRMFTFHAPELSLKD